MDIKFSELPAMATIVDDAIFAVSTPSNSIKFKWSDLVTEIAGKILEDSEFSPGNNWTSTKYGVTQFGLAQSLLGLESNANQYTDDVMDNHTSTYDHSLIGAFWARVGSTLVPKNTGDGMQVDGAVDFTDVLTVDVINESTTGVGVTLESILLKDGNLTLPAGSSRIIIGSSYGTEQHTVRATQSESIRWVGPGSYGENFRHYFGGNFDVWFGQQAVDEFTQFTKDTHYFSSNFGEWFWGNSYDHGETMAEKWMRFSLQGLWLFDNGTIPTTMMLAGSGNTATRMPGYYTQRCRGTIDSPTNISAGDDLARYGASGYRDTGYQGAWEEKLTAKAVGTSTVDGHKSWRAALAGVFAEAMGLDATDWDMNAAERAMDMLWKDSRGLNTLSYDDANNILTLNGMSVEEDALVGGGGFNSLPYSTLPTDVEHGDVLFMDNGTFAPYIHSESNSKTYRYRPVNRINIVSASGTFTISDDVDHYKITADATITFGTPAVGKGAKVILRQGAGTSTLVNVSGLTTLNAGETITVIYDTTWEVW